MNSGPVVRILYEAQDFPIFQNRVYDTREDARACAKGDICLVEDQETGLIYNKAFCQERMRYDKNYQNEQALSEVFREHLEVVANIIDESIGRKSIVEVGCGKGFFLEILHDKGFDIAGFDPTYEGDNPRVAKCYFDPASGIRATGLVLRHVLEHIKDPYQFLVSLRDANGGTGKIYIEVPCLDWICRHGAWFDIFYEHVNYFRLIDFHRMFGCIETSGYLFGGQYLYVVADLESLIQPIFDPAYSVNWPVNFGKNLGIKNQPSTINNRAAIWGGASKGVIFALLRERMGAPIDIVIDINPAKQGKYLPATGLRVLSPEEGLSRLAIGSTIFIMNSNYLPEIKEMSNNRYQYIGVDRD